MPTDALQAVTDADIDGLLDWLEAKGRGGRTLTFGEATRAVRALRAERDALRANSEPPTRQHE